MFLSSPPQSSRFPSRSPLQIIFLLQEGANHGTAPTAPTAPSQLEKVGGWSFFRGRVGALGAGAPAAPRCPPAQRRSATAHRGPRGQRGGELPAVRDCAHLRSMQVRPDHTFANLLASHPDPAPPERPALTARVPRRGRKERLSYTGRREARAAQRRSSEGAEPPLHARRDGRSRGHRLHEGATRRGAAADQATVLVCACVSRCGRPSPHGCTTLVVGQFVERPPFGEIFGDPLFFFAIYRVAPWAYLHAKRRKNRMLIRPHFSRT